MKNRSLLIFVISLVIGFFVTSAFADKKNVDKKEKKVEKTEKPKKSHRRVASCGLYASLSHLTGEFNGSDSSDRLVRKGFAPAMTCSYNRGRTTLKFGSEFYIGDFRLTHEEDGLKGTASYLEVGFKEWVKAILNLPPVKLGVTFGVQRTRGSRFDVENVEVDFGGGWFDFTELATEHLSSSADLQIWEVELDAKFPFRKNWAVTFGVLWQNFSGGVRVKVDEEGRELLESLHYNVDKVDRKFDFSTQFFYFTPQVERCEKNWCTALKVPWGVFKSDKWSWGLTLETGLRF